MEYKEFKGKSVEEALTAASVELGVTSTELEYEVVEKGSSGFLGIGAKPAVIKARKKVEETPVEKKSEMVENSKKNLKNTEKNEVSSSTESNDEIVKKTSEYLEKLFAAMKIDTKFIVDYNENNNIMHIDLDGPEMGILIGKRGQTLDCLEYLVYVFVNKESESKINVKLDTENYRSRRRDTLENLARNIAYKVKRDHKSITLEPMNNTERKIIHSTLQNDKYVTTESVGEEPFRRVVVRLKK
jgi:spoIIIJ-associated protein